MGPAASGVGTHFSAPALLRQLSPWMQQLPGRRLAVASAAPRHPAVPRRRAARWRVKESRIARACRCPAHASVDIGSAAAELTLFGVRHAEEDDGIGEYILSHRPVAVVVETALTTAHGARTGNVFRLDDPGTVQELQRDLRARMMCQLGLKLRDTPEPADDPIWQVVPCARMHFGDMYCHGEAPVFGGHTPAWAMGTPRKRRGGSLETTPRSPANGIF